MSDEDRTDVIECPGVYRLAAMRDGAMARLRVPGGRMAVPALRGVADAARRFGSGRVDLTSRANLQLRGLDTARHDALLAALGDAGLLPRTPAADRLRNIVASPLGDARLADLTARIDAALEEAAGDLEGLPVKAAIVLDAGTGDVIGLGHDLGFLAKGGDRWQISLAGHPQPFSVTANAVPGVVLGLFGTMARTGERIADRLAREGANALLRDAGATLAALYDAPIRWPEPADDLGALSDCALALGVPRGGLDAGHLDALAGLADGGDGVVRLAPGRRIVLAGFASEGLRDMLDRAVAHGFRTVQDAVRIVSCVGARGCARTAADVRGDAARLAEALEGRGVVASIVHLTGCARGCARAAPADWLLRAEGDGYALFADARADSAGSPLETMAGDTLLPRLAARLAAFRDAA